MISQDFTPPILPIFHFTRRGMIIVIYIYLFASCLRRNTRSDKSPSQDGNKGVTGTRPDLSLADLTNPVLRALPRQRCRARRRSHFEAQCEDRRPVQL